MYLSLCLLVSFKIHPPLLRVWVLVHIKQHILRYLIICNYIKN